MEIKEVIKQIQFYANTEVGANEFDVKAIKIDGDEVIINPEEKSIEAITADMPDPEPVKKAKKSVKIKKSK